MILLYNTHVFVARNKRHVLHVMFVPCRAVLLYRHLRPTSLSVIDLRFLAPFRSRTARQRERFVNSNPTTSAPVRRLLSRRLVSLVRRDARWPSVACRALFPQPGNCPVVRDYNAPCFHFGKSGCCFSNPLPRRPAPLLSLCLFGFLTDSNGLGRVAIQPLRISW